MPPEQGTLFALPEAGDPGRSKPLTLAQARRDLQAALDDGTTCPCCDQRAQRYHRRLNAGMAVALIALVRVARDSEDGWAHAAQVQRWIVGRLSAAPAHPTGELGKLVHWGLVEQRPKDDDDDTGARTSGYWRPTGLGTLFACGKQSVPSHVKLYNGASEGLDGEWITIETALGRRFDWTELMAGGRP